MVLPSNAGWHTRNMYAKVTKNNQVMKNSPIIYDGFCVFLYFFKENCEYARAEGA